MHKALDCLLMAISAFCFFCEKSKHWTTKKRLYVIHSSWTFKLFCLSTVFVKIIRKNRRDDIPNNIDNRLAAVGVLS